MDRYLWISGQEILEPSEHGIEQNPVYGSPAMAEEVAEQILEQDGYQPEDLAGFKLQKIGDEAEMEIEEVYTVQSGFSEFS